MPGVFMSSRKYVMPRWRNDPCSVRASRMAQSEYWAPLVHTFWPCTIQPSPSRSAFVRRLARSEPASGSLKSWHQMCSPRRIGSRNCACCSGVPWAISVGATICSPTLDRLSGVA